MPIWRGYKGSSTGREGVLWDPRDPLSQQPCTETIRAFFLPPVPGVITPAQPGGPKVGNIHYIPCKFNRKWVGILCNHEAKGTGRPPSPP